MARQNAQLTLLVKGTALALALAVIFVLAGAPCLAATTPPGLQQAEKELRNAQRLMFGGKSADAIALLPRIRQLLEEGKQAAPDNPKVKSVESQLSKLVKDLERRTGQDLGGGSATVKEGSSAPPPPSKPQVKPVAPAASPTASATASKTASGPPTKPVAPAKTQAAAKSDKLPYYAAGKMRELGQVITRIEGNIKRLKDPQDRFNKDQLTQNIKDAFAEAGKTLAQAKEEAAKKGMNAHPSFDEAQAKLDSMSKDYQTAVQNVTQNKAAAAQAQQGIEADVQALTAEQKRLQPVFDKAPGVVIYYNDLQPVKELLALIQQFEQKEAKPLEDKLKAFAAKYGDTPDAIDAKTKAAGYGGPRASYPYETLKQGMAKVIKTRQVMAEDLVAKVDQKLENLAKIHDFFRLKQHQDIKEWLSTAAALQADNPKVKKALAEIDGKLAQDTKAFKERLAGRAWPKHAETAPSGASDLAKNALEMFKKDPGWGRRDQNARAKDKEPRRPLAVVVTGPWSIQKRNVMSEPIMWGLPIKLAVQLDSEKDKGIARVFILTLRTEEARGVKKAPPFTSVTVGDSYYILADKVR